MNRMVSMWGIWVLVCTLLVGCGGGSSDPSGATLTTTSGANAGGGIGIGATPTPTPTPTQTTANPQAAFAINNNLTFLQQDTVDPTTGALTPVGSPIPLPGFITSDPLGNNMIAFTSDGTTGFVANSATTSADPSQNPQADVTVLNISSSGAVTTSTVPTFEQNKPTALAVDPSNQFLYAATNLDEPQIEMSPILGGTLTGFTRVGQLPSPSEPTSISALATTTVGNIGVVVAMGGNPSGFGTNVASYIINQPDGTLLDNSGNNAFTAGDAASSFQLDQGNGPPSQPTAMRIAAVGGTPFVYFGGSTGQIFVSSFNADGTLNPPALATGVSGTVGGAPVADLQIANIGSTPVLYVLSNGTGQQLQAFDLNSDGSVGGQIGATASTPQNDAAISLAVHAVSNVLYVGTATDPNPPNANVAEFTLNSDGSIGAGTAINDGDPDTSGTPGARSITLMNLPSH